MKPSQATSPALVTRIYDTNVAADIPDDVAVEEPLEIRLGIPGSGHRPVSITMRTPGDDLDLAAGFLFTEGIIESKDQIAEIRHCGKLAESATRTIGPTTYETNTVRVELAEASSIDLKRLERHFYTTSSCGVCGKTSIEALFTGAKKLDSGAGPFISADLIRGLPGLLRKAQEGFERTGGLHASALFTPEGDLDVVREDVGRHNALDKVIGGKFLDGSLPLSDSVLMVSGRASFELVQKALMAGIPILAAVGAPSSLAVDLAMEFGMTLVGFVKGDSINVYCGARRVTRERMNG